MAAVVTLLEMTTENRSPADLYRGHDAALCRGKRSAMLSTIGSAVAAKYIRHLKLRAIHFRELTRSTVERAWAQRQPAAAADQGGWQWNILC